MLEVTLGLGLGNKLNNLSKFLLLFVRNNSFNFPEDDSDRKSALKLNKNS